MFFAQSPKGMEPSSLLFTQQRLQSRIASGRIKRRGARDSKARWSIARDAVLCGTESYLGRGLHNLGLAGEGLEGWDYISSAAFRAGR